MEQPNMDPEGHIIIESPAVEVPTADGVLILTWANATIRTFKDSQFNHIEYRNDEGKLQGIQCGQDLMDQLFDLEFPLLSMPYTDRATFDWLFKLATKNFEVELTDGAAGVWE